MLKLQKILVATDFSPAADAAVQYARDLARQLDARFEVLHVWDDAATGLAGVGSYTVEIASLRREAQAWTEEKLATILSEQDRTTLKATVRMISSHHPATAIIEHASAHGFDLIITGSHGRTGVERLLLGSVAERVVRLARCPVLTVKHPEHDFVVADALERRAEA